MIDPCYPYPLSSRRVKGLRPLRFPKAAPLVGFGAKPQDSAGAGEVAYVGVEADGVDGRLGRLVVDDDVQTAAVDGVLFAVDVDG